MKKLEILFGVLRLPADALAVIAALLIAYALRMANVDLVPGFQLLDTATTLPPFDVYVWDFLLPSVVMYLGASALLNLYNFRATTSAWREISEICTAAATWLVIVMAWYFFLRKELFYSRILLLHATLLLAFFVILLRSLLTIIYRWLLKKGYGVRHVLTIGHTLSQAAEEAIRGERTYVYLGHVTTFQEFQARLNLSEIDLVLETCPRPDSADTLDLIDYCRSHHIDYAFLPPVFAESPHLLSVEHIGLLPLVRFQPTPLDGWGRVWKALMDYLGAAILVVVLSPVLLVIAMCVVIESGWPVFYVSWRVGQHGKLKIPVLKFRSMIKNADELKSELANQNHRRDGPLFKVRHDPRVTRVGRVLRRWSLDELPQLFNVLVGHLSLVGPRPHLEEEVNLYASRERRVFAVKPGVTGLAQVSGRSDLTFADEIRLDLQYIEEWSPKLDLWVLWRTIRVVFARDGAD